MRFTGLRSGLMAAAVFIVAAWPQLVLAQPEQPLYARALIGQDDHETVYGYTGPIVASRLPNAKTRTDFGHLAVFARIPEGGIADSGAIAWERFQITGLPDGTPVEFEVAFEVEGSLTTSHANTSGYVGAFLQGFPTETACPPYPGLSVCTAAYYEHTDGTIGGTRSQRVRVQLVAGQAYWAYFNMGARVLHFGGLGAAGTSIEANFHSDGTAGARYWLTAVTPGVDYVTQSGRRYDAPVTNTAPTANAGPNQTVRPGTTVVLDGSGSFDDNTPTHLLQYSWSFESVPNGSTAVLLNAGTASPSFLPDRHGRYVVRLVVTDQEGVASAPSDVTIGENPPPTADAGLDQVVIVGAAASLSGAGTDTDGDLLTYEWRLTGAPEGSSAVLAAAQSTTPTLTPDLPGTYTVSLTVSDPFGPGEPDEVRVTAITATTYVTLEIQQATALIVGLGGTAVTNAGNQNALTQFLRNAVASIEGGDPATTRQHLAHAISRTDGCAMRGAADGGGPGRDWVTACAAQAPIYQALVNALELLEP